MKRVFVSLAEYAPEIANEWHPTLNGELTPWNVSYGRDKKVWWQCLKPNCEDHVWDETPHSRSGQQTSCPCCQGKKVVPSNSLATTHPEIAAEWHPTKNGSLTPWNVRYGSVKKVWWKCLKENCDDHEWETAPNSRTNMKSGCPCCDGIKVVPSNSLATTHPKLAAEWHPTKNGLLTPWDVSHGSNIKVWWKCLKDNCDDHEWEASPDVRRNWGCRCCNNRKAVSSNCLATTHPQICKEWHPTKNLTLTPYDFTKSSGVKVWWVCDKGHDWQADIDRRAADGNNSRGCPHCNESKGEKKIQETLAKLECLYARQKRFTSCKLKKPLPFDFAVCLWDRKPGLIEYQGEQHYRPIEYWGGQATYDSLKKRDQIKRDWCKTKGVPLLEIPYTEYENIPKLVEDFVKNRL